MPGMSLKFRLKSFQHKVFRTLCGWMGRATPAGPPQNSVTSTVNMLFGVIQMRLDQHALLLSFTFSHRETPGLSSAKMHVCGVNRVILHSVKAGCPIRGNKYLCTLVSLNLGWPWITKPALGGAQHSTEVTFALLTQQPRVRFLEFPKLLEIKSMALRVWRSLNKLMEPSSTSPELVLQKTCVDQPIGHDWGSTLGTLTSDWRQMGAKLRFKVRSKLLLLGIPNISLAKKGNLEGQKWPCYPALVPGDPGTWVQVSNTSLWLCCHVCNTTAKFRPCQPRDHASCYSPCSDF